MIKRGKAEKQAARGARLSVALRENLKRRRAQARARSAGQPAAGTTLAPQPAAGEPSGPDFRRNPGWKSDSGGQGSGG